MNQRQKNREYFRLHSGGLDRLAVLLGLEILCVTLIFQQGLALRDFTCLFGIAVAAGWVNLEFPNYFREENIVYRCLPVGEAVALVTWQWKPMLVGEFVPVLLLIAGALNGDLSRAYVLGVVMVAGLVWFEVEACFASIFYKEEPDIAKTPNIERAFPVILFIAMCLLSSLRDNFMLGGLSPHRYIFVAAMSTVLAGLLHRYNVRHI